MNIQYARTFLEIVQSGNFNKAAERLHVTQSTVTMRVKTLEESLGQPLFIRNKAGTQLTAAGIQFQRYAETLVRTWQQAPKSLPCHPNSGPRWPSVHSLAFGMGYLINGCQPFGG